MGNLWRDIKCGESVTVNGVTVHPWVAFTYTQDEARGVPWPDAWFSDLVNRALPEMGSECMELFMDCGFVPGLFFAAVENEGIEAAARSGGPEAALRAFFADPPEAEGPPCVYSLPETSMKDYREWEMRRLEIKRSKQGPPGGGR